MPTPTTLADHLANLAALVAAAQDALRRNEAAYAVEADYLRAHTSAVESGAPTDVTAMLRRRADIYTAVADAAFQAKRDALEKAAEAAAFLARFA
jgi:hypothetical protein